MITPLQKLARSAGLYTSYVDMQGRRQAASPETLTALLKLFDIQADTPQQIRDALRAQKRRLWQQCLEPVLVAWDGAPLALTIRLQPAPDLQKARLRLRLEDGSVQELDWRATSLAPREQVQIDGQAFMALPATLPALPNGYHTLELEAGGLLHKSLLLAAPGRTYSPPAPERIWGVFLPLYALHSAQSWGAGSLAEWRQLTDWTASLGGKVTATVPLLAAFLAPHKCEPSPYSPVSRLFWNEFYLDIPALPEFGSCPEAQRLVQSGDFQAATEQFRRGQFIDYCPQMQLRRQVLQLLAESFFAAPGTRRKDFESFLQSRHRVKDYAAFRAQCDRTAQGWPQWPEAAREGDLNNADYLESDYNYHLYVQWAIQDQMEALRTQCAQKGVRFYLDLPLGVNSEGYDVWRERQAFAQPAAAGAPPDFFFTRGQNWGFAPLHPDRIRHHSYRYVREYLAFHMRHAGLLRLDHVMGLHRLYWIPPGFEANQGAYVRYPAEELYALLSLESHRSQTILVGENLGTVPPEINRALETHGLRQLYVLQYEQRPDPKKAVRRPAVPSVAALNSHDMPPFAAHWEALDIEDQVALGLVSEHDLPAKKDSRRLLNQALIEFLSSRNLLKPGPSQPQALLEACLLWLSKGPAEIVLVNLEDLWLEVHPQNVPGTYLERPNWRRKSRLSLETILRSKEIHSFLETLNRLR